MITSVHNNPHQGWDDVFVCKLVSQTPEGVPYTETINLPCRLDYAIQLRTDESMDVQEYLLGLKDVFRVTKHGLWYGHSFINLTGLLCAHTSLTPGAAETIHGPHLGMDWGERKQVYDARGEKFPSPFLEFRGTTRRGKTFSVPFYGPIGHRCALDTFTITKTGLYAFNGLVFNPSMFSRVVFLTHTVNTFAELLEKADAPKSPGD